MVQCGRKANHVKACAFQWHREGAAAYFFIGIKRKYLGCNVQTEEGNMIMHIPCRQRLRELTRGAADLTDTGFSELTDHGINRLEHGVEVLCQIGGITGREPVEIREIFFRIRFFLHRLLLYGYSPQLIHCGQKPLSAGQPYPALPEPFQQSPVGPVESGIQ